MSQQKPIPLDEIKGRLQDIKNTINQTPDNKPYAIFEPFGLNEQNLAQNEKLLNTAFRKLALHFHPDKRAHENEKDKELNDQYWDKLSKAYHALQAKLKGSNSINIYSSAAENIPSSPGEGPVFKAHDGFKLEDFIKEFKDFYKQQSGKEFSEKEAGKEGYSFKMTQDAKGNQLLELSCPNLNLRNNLIQRLLDKNMMSSALPSLQETEAANKNKLDKASPPELKEASTSEPAQETKASLPSAFNPRATPSLKPSEDGPSE